ncbi:class I SAM-dependent methyltransferase [Pseudonocardiaceae bacterium YIM PH 21723]|nr:class I SAM-dependent methyltransferase [Pseudonocardiaceae bacterium YIM PH 21723]
MGNWSHNAYYQRLLLREVPAGSDRVLDVGCGTGALASRLAERATAVDALDIDPDMIDTARRRVPGNVRCLLADAMEHPLEASGYDAIVSLTTLHHLPLEPALRRLSAAVRPGGVLAVVAMPRIDLPRDLPVELLAIAGQRALGAAFGVLGRYQREEADVSMPTKGSDLTTAQVRDVATRVLPGSHVRRLVFWRYLLRWQRPS